MILSDNYIQLLKGTIGCKILSIDVSKSQMKFEPDNFYKSGFEEYVPPMNMHETSIVRINGSFQSLSFSVSCYEDSTSDCYYIYQQHEDNLRDFHRIEINEKLQQLEVFGRLVPQRAKTEMNLSADVVTTQDLFVITLTNQSIVGIWLNYFSPAINIFWSQRELENLYSDLQKNEIKLIKSYTLTH